MNYDYFCHMAKPGKIIKSVLLVLLGILLLIQFARIEKNEGGPSTHDISTAFPVPDRVQSILKTACNDCHSNTTIYPWYANIQPVAWWLAGHVEDGKRHLNFSEFTTYRPYRQYHKLEEIDEVLLENEMPMTSYTLIHRDAKLDEAQKEILINWSKSLRDSMQSRYPADSLVKPKKN
jgi:hypothetical protein